jgi:hypothetical protein
MLDAAGLGTLLRGAQRDLFRMEALDRYEVPSDGGDYHRYLRGERGPDPQRKSAWHERLRAERDRGLRRRRVHAVTEPLSDYLRFEFEWGHALNTELEDIRVLPASLRPAGLVPSDFYLVDDRDVVAMHYDEAGKFTGAEVLHASELARYRKIRDAAWEAAVPFKTWWADHPQYHRRDAA